MFGHEPSSVRLTLRAISMSFVASQDTHTKP